MLDEKIYLVKDAQIDEDPSSYCYEEKVQNCIKPGLVAFIDSNLPTREKIITKQIAYDNVI